MPAEVKSACVVGPMPPMAPVPIRTVGRRFKFVIALVSTRKWIMTANWVVDVPLPESNDTKKVVVPKGYTHDGASVPPAIGAIAALTAIYYIENWFLLAATLFLTHRVIKYILSSIGLPLIPGIVHDYLFRHHKLECLDGSTIYEGCTLYQADDLFRRLHVKVNDMPLIARFTHVGLRMGSWLPWYRARQRWSIDRPDR